MPLERSRVGNERTPGKGVGVFEDADSTFLMLTETLPDRPGRLKNNCSVPNTVVLNLSKETNNLSNFGHIGPVKNFSRGKTLFCPQLTE